MKNKHMTIVALAAAALATSCASEDIAEPQKQGQNQGETRTVTLTASVADDDNTTRVGMTKDTDDDGNDNDKASFYWHKNDAISVLTANGTTYGNAKFATDATTGETSATFTGDVTGTVGGYAVYPYSESHTFTSATALTYNLPAEYNSYTPEAKIFGMTDAYPANSTNMPMLGTISGNSIEFKHIGGLLVIRVDEMPFAEGTLTVTADQQLSGNFAVSDLSVEGAQIATTTASDGNGKVTFNFSEATEGSAGVFYLPLATGTYNFQVTLSNGSDYEQTVSYDSKTISRAAVSAVSLTTAAYVKVDGHWFVDLGLTSGLLWATTNIGATSPSNIGSYFYWGMTTACGESTTYDSSISAKYSSGDVLASADDAACVNWGTSCRMPTMEECQELANSTSQSLSGNGLKVVSKNNGSSIYLPTGTYSYSVNFCYWTATNAGDGWARSLGKTWQNVLSCSSYSSMSCGNGYPVRAVAKKPTE